MYPKLLKDSSVLNLLVRVDRDLALRLRALGCAECGGVLHEASYPRRPRGPWALGSEMARRASFCCAACRKRATPASVVFLARRWYLGAVIVLVAALREGPTPTRMARIEMEWGVPERTVARWRAWWKEQFAASPFWREARVRLGRPGAEDSLPFSLVEVFGVEEDARRVVDLLRWLSPVSTNPWLAVHAF